MKRNKIGNQGLVIKKISSKFNYSLQNTTLIFVSESFTYDSKNNFLYTHSENNTISAYTMVPFNKIKSLEYKKNVKDILITNNSMFLLTEDSVILNSKNSFNSFCDNFKNSKFVKMKEKNEKVEFLLGIQKTNEIHLFDKNLRRLNIFESNTSFIFQDMLILGYLDVLKIIKNNDIIRIAIPNIITCITANKNFIFTATVDNKIYKLDIKNNEMTVLDYHNQPVIEMEISLCNNYLYSNDKNKICCWNIEHEIVITFIEEDEGFDQISVVDLNEVDYNNESCYL